jgi:YD repeat-containing protein
MMKGKRARKAIAFSLLLVFATNTFAPTAVFALTSGPTSPEANSFEPVDTNQIVNYQTGDFTYNIPLLEVPGPEQGYPLSLSYSPATSPNMDASWVGLGWSLNPGSINRSVNGYADDLKGVNDVTRTYNDGGSTHKVGINVGFGLGPANVGFGLTVVSDTYKGVGVGFGLSFGHSSLKGADFNLRTDPYGGAVSVGVDLSVSAPLGAIDGALTGMRLSQTVSFETNFQSISGSASIGLKKSIEHGKGSLGISLASSGNASFSMNGVSSSVSNSTAGKWQTRSSGFSFGIPIGGGVSIGLSYNYTRYWSDETNNVLVFGGLYNRLENIPQYDPNSWFSGFNANTAYDTYELLDPEKGSIVDYPDPREVLGGSFQAHDNYVVAAQGLGGTIRPYSFQEQLFNQNYLMNGGTSTRVAYMNYKSGWTNPLRKQFRFSGDFSNTYRQDPEDVTYSTTEQAPYTGAYQAIFHFDNSPTYPTDGYNASENRLSGSKHIEYFTNGEIANGTAKSRGFIDYDIYTPFVTANFRPTSGDGADRIGAFSITNVNGLTYHFALAAHSRFEFSYTEKTNTSIAQWSHISKAYDYAYTWYLTTITGPDFVDRNNNGKADINDWGLWINYDYAMWETDYGWRNPGLGFHRDLDNDFQNFSKGIKEVYYLNAIRTRSHTALFVKDIREDGRGAANLAGAFQRDEGGFNSTSKYTMRLDKIYLFNNADVTGITTSGNPYGSMGAGSNVLNTGDIAAGDIAKAIRTIEFKYDYSLCPGTSNSFASNKGKLTLKSVQFKGVNGASQIPPMLFQYELPAADVKTGSITTVTTDAASQKGTFTSFTSFDEGEILSITNGVSTWYGAITKKINSTTYQIVYTSATYPPNNQNGTATTTKNPCYNSDAVDIWGNYKSDYRKDIAKNHNVAKATSSASAKGVDAWCLRKIVSALGAEINVDYESDTYATSVYDNFSSYTIRDVTHTTNGNGTVNISFYIKDMEDVTQEYLQVNDPISLLVMKRRNCQNGIYAMSVTETTLNSDEKGSVSVSSIAADGKVTVTTAFTWPEYTGCDVNGCTPSGWCIYIGGNVKLIEKDVNKYGGGLRVKAVRVVNTTDNSVMKSVYEYNRLSNTAVSSGTTSYEPKVMPYFDFYPYNAWPDPIKVYRTALLSGMNRFLSLTREIPPPGIMYEFVTSKRQMVSQGVENEMPGKVAYQFRVFNDRMVLLTDNIPRVNNTTTRNDVRNLSVKNFSNSLGAVKRIIAYDNLGNKLSEVINNYLDDGLDNLSYASVYDIRIGTQFNYQGVIKERYALKKYWYDPANNNYTAYFGTITSMREEYPSVMTGQTVINYKTNLKTESKVLGFDFYNGEVTRKLDIDPYGNRFITENEFAYRKYTGMGLKGMNFHNKNMLNQGVASYTYKVDQNDQRLGLVDADIYNWSNTSQVFDAATNTYVVQNDVSSPGLSGNGNVWRKINEYSWEPEGQTGDGITAYNSFADFNWANPSGSNSAWKKTGETTLFNVYSTALELKDGDGNYQSVRLDLDNTRVLMTSNYAGYFETAYTGFEDYNTSTFTMGGGPSLIGAVSVTNAVAHTGKKSILVTPTGMSNAGAVVYTVPANKLQTNTDYLISVWAKAHDQIFVPTNVDLYYTVNGTPYTGEFYKCTSNNGWHLLEFKVNKNHITPGSIIVAGARLQSNTGGTQSVYFDDFRFQPYEAITASYVYDYPTGQLTHILDDNGLYTRFQYDDHGRLLKTFKENCGAIGETKLNEYEYNFGRNCMIPNDPISNQPYYRQNCPAGTNPVAYNVSVPAGQFVGCSQQEANQLAADYAQNQANINGGCASACYFSMFPGYTLVSSNITNSGGTVNFYIVWYSMSTTMVTGSSYTIAQIMGGCNPSSTRTINFTQSGRTWQIIVSGSYFNVRITSGPNLPAGSTGYVTGSYTL